MTKIIKGSFEVKAMPQPPNDILQKLGAGAMVFEKTFQGALEATSIVSMIGMMNNELKSGAYIALEKITGTIDGRNGSFCLQHSSSMERGKASQTITVVPDTGTDAFTGLKGEMKIDIVDGKHFYTFNYEMA